MHPDADEMVSGEGVRLELSRAGVGSRTVAAAIDVTIQFVAFIVVTLVTFAVARNADEAAQQAVAVTEVVLILAGYPIVLEWLTRGRTVGKICMGLRVVRDDGGPIGFRQALTRGLAGLIIEKPGLLAPLSTLIGVVTVSTSAREKRVGDMLAGTVVLNERSAPQPLATPPGWVPPPLQHWVLSLDLHRLDDGLALLMRQFVSRAHAMSPGAQSVVGDDLRRRVLEVTSPPPPDGVPTPPLLMSVLAERRRRAFAANPVPQPAFPIHPPPQQGWPQQGWPQQPAWPQRVPASAYAPAPAAVPPSNDEPPELPFARPR